ncbi:glutamate-5-semialdehyde dehydrogenase [Sutterella sp. AM11-39]|uniref:glutamate-5-semialdehyde dehydrogenase n=1 Tax=Sutterella sp. AM11-39 TaxID=2292075 RepID=UPI000E50E5A9|nr:glutamate-5-semialdehyde dehydrogenase [Sutterella sp. AM11-39]RHJ32126.1 glutamate-5-semialdehyde dehydrogenase [Sutterella sp. AM11-39]
MTTSVSKLMIEAGQKARAASRRMAAASTADKNKVLLRLAELLEAKKEDIFAANEQDLVKAKENGLKESFVDRLRVTEKVLGLMAEGARQTAALPDPVGEISEMRRRPSGIQVGRMRVPLGVLGIIYESRPNVTVDAACLAVKSGNACILRGGSEAFETNRILGELVQQALTETGLPTEAVQIAPTTDRDFVGEMIRANKYVDVIIPRGGKGLIARLAAEATVPMIHHLDGICHTYVDKDAVIDMAVSVTDNAKTQRYSPCNATETLLVHEAVADVFLPRIGKIFAEKNVEMRCDAKSKAVLEASGLSCVDADPSDWDTEYNAPIISIAVVKSLDEAIAFIEEHSSKHTDAIITNNLQASQRFLREVDSGSVMVNCSTRFADGFEYGLGAEIGISTGKLHARGPVGLEGLTSLKYVVIGNGEGRQ